MAAFQKDSQDFPRWLKGFLGIYWKQAIACVCVYWEDGGCRKVLSSAKKAGKNTLALVYNLSIWRAEPAMMEGDSVLDGDGDRERGEFLRRQEEHLVGQQIDFGCGQIP